LNSTLTALISLIRRSLCKAEELGKQHSMDLLQL
jgi:hypothetical protein